MNIPQYKNNEMNKLKNLIKKYNSNASYYIFDENSTDDVKQKGGGSCESMTDDQLKTVTDKTNDPNSPNSSNGLITSIWGPHEWESFHSKTFGYPIAPSEQEKINYLIHFTSLGDVLPCKYCRESYKKFISEGDTILNMDTMQSRESLTKWGHRLHDAVNQKLGMDYGVTYEEMCFKFESYRARCTKTDKGCIMPLDEKAQSYQKAETQRAPIVNKKYCEYLIPYAKYLGLHGFGDSIDKYSTIKRNSPKWAKRDCDARRIINHMRKNGISALEPNGMPSLHEMLLLSMLSTTIDKEKLIEIVNKTNKLFMKNTS